MSLSSQVRNTILKALEKWDSMTPEHETQVIAEINRRIRQRDIVNRLKAEAVGGETAWHLISDQELNHRDSMAQERGAAFSARIAQSSFTIWYAHKLLWDALDRVAGTCFFCDLLPAEWQTEILRTIMRGANDLPANKALVQLADQLDELVKDYGPFLDKHAPGLVDHATINKHRLMAGAVREAILALLRENDPDDGKLLRQAIASHSPNSDQQNREWKKRLGDLHANLGPPTQAITDEARKLLKAALDEFHIEKGRRGYREKVRSGAMKLLVRQQNVKDANDLFGFEHQVCDYLADIDDTRISQLLGEGDV